LKTDALSTLCFKTVFSQAVIPENSLLVDFIVLVLIQSLFTVEDAMSAPFSLLRNVLPV